MWEGQFGSGKGVRPSGSRAANVQPPPQLCSQEQPPHVGGAVRRVGDNRSADGDGRRRLIVSLVTFAGELDTNRGQAWRAPCRSTTWRVRPLLH